MGIAEEVKKDIELKKREGDPKARRDLPDHGGQQPDGKSRKEAEEEKENEDVEAMKKDIQSVKEETARSSENAQQAAQRAEGIGRDALGRLGVQGERINEAEKDIDVAAGQGKMGEENTGELERENRTMFARLRPRTKKNREKEERKIVERHQKEREQREGARKKAAETDKRMEGHFRDVDQAKPAQDQKDFGDRKKYQFEPGEEDEKTEENIDENLDALQQATGRLGGLAKATGDEMKTQDQDLNRVMEKSDKADARLRLNQERLNRIN